MLHLSASLGAHSYYFILITSKQMIIDIEGGFSKDCRCGGLVGWWV